MVFNVGADGNPPAISNTNDNPPVISHTDGNPPVISHADGNPPVISNSAEYWNAEAKNFDSIYREDGSVRGPLNKLLRSDMEGRYIFALKCAGLDARPSVLEIGCGTGIHSRGFLEGGASHVTGVDLSAEMLKIASSRLENFEGRVTLIEGDFMTEDFEGRAYDVVTAIGVFDYVEDSPGFMKKAMSLANGRFIATFPRSGTPRSLIRSVRLSLKRCPVYFYSKDRIDAMAEECGAVIQRHEIIGQLHCAAFTRGTSGT